MLPLDMQPHRHAIMYCVITISDILSLIIYLPPAILFLILSKKKSRYADFSLCSDFWQIIFITALIFLLQILFSKTKVLYLLQEAKSTYYLCTNGILTQFLICWESQSFVLSATASNHYGKFCQILSKIMKTLCYSKASSQADFGY